MVNIIKTNWVTFLGVFIMAIVFTTISNSTSADVSLTILQSMLAALVLVCFYGVLFWVVFVIAIIMFDILLFRESTRRLTSKLILEWIIISIPFWVIAVKYNRAIFFILSATFLVTQIVRKTKLKSILE